MTFTHIRIWLLNQEAPAFRYEVRHRGDKIEVTLDWYEDNDTVDLGVLK